MSDDETPDEMLDLPLLAVDGYVPAPGLHAIDQSLLTLVPFNVGERVAFQENHHLHGGKYGVIQAIGFAEGGIRLDLLVFDPHTGDPTKTHTLEDNGDHTGEILTHEPVIARITIGELQ